MEQSIEDVKDRSYEIRDSIWGYISFNEPEKSIISSQAFQRLRRIKQLALTEMVYPGAVGTRFEHSLGVMHLASLMYDRIIKKDKKMLEKGGYLEGGEDKNRCLIRLAALLHDVGHAPFSHASEELMPINNKTKKKYAHEDYTCAIITGPLKEYIEPNEWGVTSEEVAGIIRGNEDDKNLLGDRMLWKDLISSQLDADRGDYLLRDSHYTGVKYGIYDRDRLLVSMGLGEDPKDKEIFSLGVEEGGWHIAESVIISRYMVFSQVAFHKTRRAYDYHIGEVMKLFLNENYGNKTLPSIEEIGDFLELDDITIWKYIKDRRKDDENCRSVIERNHLRPIFETPETMPSSDKGVKDYASKFIEFERITDHLKRKGIFFHEDRADKIWYDPLSDEIKIIDKNKKISQLSNYSRVVKSLGEIDQRRIYVKPKDREEAEKILKNKS